MRRRLAVLLVSLLMVPRVIAGQNVTPAARVAPGARVRVTHPAEGTRVGTALAITDDLLFVRWSNDSDTVGVPLAEVTRLDVSDGRNTHRTLKRTGIGIVAGAGLGAIIGAVSTDKSQPFITQGELAGVGALLVGTLGGLMGLVSGVLQSEPWQEVPLDRSRVGIVATPGGHGTRLGFALAF
jgi:hypothetical protein